jgi:outer membrane protein TolC
MLRPACRKALPATLSAMRLAISVIMAARVLVRTVPLAILVGCATYSPLPLAVQAQPKASVEGLQHTTALPRSLGIEDIAVLAVQNNPDLLAARAQRGLAQAQVLSAGILPNPSLSAGYGFLISGPGTTNPITLALSEDLRSLMARSSKRRAARQSAQAIDASLLWEEWQIIAKARLQVVDLIEGEQQRVALQRTVTLLLERTARGREALARGDSTLVTLLPDLSAAADARKRLDDLERQQESRRRDLNTTLGLAQQAPLLLDQHMALPPIDADAVQQNLDSLADRRPDLLALRLGYRAQEERLRGAILAQFPLLSLGVSADRDNTNVRTIGPQITLELPLFDHNQGNIAVERATRQQLHDEFTARELAARSEVLALLADQTLLQQQLIGKRSELSELARVSARAVSAFGVGDLDERSYVDVVSAHSAKEQEVLAMEQSVLEQQVAIATLIGAGMPPASFQ